jgi:hypothetical protein
MSRIVSTGLGLYTAIVVVQGTHLFEHVVQLIQVFVLGIPDDRALGLLGYAFQFQGTEEWLHLAFNATFLLTLYLLIGFVRQLTPSIVPASAFGYFLLGVSVETWHMAEHVVIIANVLANDGCPCPGILDPVLGVSDTILHFLYNAAVYALIMVPFWHLLRAQARTAPRSLPVRASIRPAI